MAKDTPVLMIGSVPLQDTEAVLRLLGDKLGTRAARYPDGETGDRINWIRWQRRSFEGNPSFVLNDTRVGFSGIKDALSHPFYRVADGVAPKDISFGDLGYAAEAKKSYAMFSKLKAEGAIPKATRFQVSLPTAVAILSGFVVVDDRAKAEPALEKAMQREVERIAQAIPADELAIQWDVCMEIVGHDGGYDLHYGDILNNSVQRVVRQIAFVPKTVEVGIHLCYGDPGHKHLIEPKDTTSSVLFANAISKEADRKVAWFHMPIPRAWMEERYYAPLAGLRLPQGTELYLGLVHLTTGPEAILTRAHLARRFIGEFGIATECGFGRRDPATIPGLLETMRAASLKLAGA